MARIIGVLLVFLALITDLQAQHNTVLMNTFFRDRFYAHTANDEVITSGLYPVYESQYDLNKKLADSTKQYYELTEILFKKHLIEVKGKDYFLTISPVADLRMGRDRRDTLGRKLYQNTRGILIEGDLLKNFSFSTSFYENQARFADYESNYYTSLGELYPNQATGKYNPQNAMIPGAARTKPFDGDGFDYAYAQGNMVYRMNERIYISAGNTPHFVGDGYRSVLYSDNSAGTPFLRGDFKFLKNLEFTYLRSRLLNLMRKPVSTTVEANYEQKGMAMHYLTYKIPAANMAISLFESTIWYKGDSLTGARTNPMFFQPLPFLSEMLIDQNKISSVTGLNMSVLLKRSHRLYGQFALTDLDLDRYALQLGYRGTNLFKLKDLMVQLEYNQISSGMYRSENRRLNYVNFNLPMAHPKGNSFSEFLIRGNYEIKRFYADLSMIFYTLKDYSSIDLLPVYREVDLQSGSLTIQQAEIGYRMNRKMNLSVFGSLTNRTENWGDKKQNTVIMLGFRTGINNHYNDF